MTKTVQSAPGNPRVGSAAHKDWIAYCKKHGVPRGAGRKPTIYDPERHPKVARKLVSLGANDWDIAQAFGIEAKTIWSWKINHPAFAEAMRYRDEDGTFQNDRVKHALLHRATGYNFHSEKIVVVEGEVKRVPIVEHVPPSDAAQRLWLQNRDAKNWNAAHNVNLHASATLDVTITKETSPKDALQAFMKLLGAPAAALTTEHEAIAPEPPGDANGSD